MSDTSDLDRQIEQLKRCEIIMEAEVKALCAKAREILVEESNVQRVDSPVTVRKCYYRIRIKRKMYVLCVYKKIIYNLVCLHFPRLTYLPSQDVSTAMKP